MATTSKKITKVEANKAAKIITTYAKQQAVKRARITGKKTANTATSVAKKGFAGLKKLFK